MTLIADMSATVDFIPGEYAAGGWMVGPWLIDDEVVHVTGDDVSIGQRWPADPATADPIWPKVRRGERGTTPARHLAGAVLTRPSDAQ